MSETKDWLQEHWEIEDRLWARFKDQPPEVYLAYLAREGRRIAVELNLPIGSPQAGTSKPSSI